ncbi:MAG: isoprenylcysteine carboxylmethyltransferase family protein [Xanthobacteraceae bacterium]
MTYSVTDRFKTIRRTKAYDLFAAAPLIAWYLIVVAKAFPTTAQEIALIKLFVETDPSALPVNLVLSAISKICSLAFLAVLVVMFAARRPPKRHAHGFYPRFVAVVGTWLSVGIAQLPPQQISAELYFVSLLLLIGGTAFAICSVIALARSISILPEARRLVTRGPYSLIRHPLYLGELVATAGLAMQFLMPWALVLLGLHCFFQFERMKNEERVLIEAFQNYRDYMARTARLIPGLY